MKYKEILCTTCMNEIGDKSRHKRTTDIRTFERRKNERKFLSAQKSGLWFFERNNNAQLFLNAQKSGHRCF